MKTNIGITESNRQQVSAELRKLLADEFVLLVKTKGAHWNVEGPDFYEKHKLFDEQAEQLTAIIDNVAERIRTLDHYVPATLKEFSELTRLSESLLIQDESLAFISQLLSDHETIITMLRKNISLFTDTYGDLGTSDFITGLMLEHEKVAWILRAHQNRKR
jgi:starvation-inducible DNA-binding protein